MRKFLIVPTALALVAPVIALAEDKPKESLEFNFGHVKPTYTESQRDVSTGLPTGKRMHKPYAITSAKKGSGGVSVQNMTVTKHVGKSSPILMQNNQSKTTITPQGGLLSPTGSSFISKSGARAGSPPPPHYDLKGNKGG